ncbi:hypothetical protein JTE90_013935 [Oedothorax gibbosus]|uniref:Sialin n=1 Tax=Oedothorax gibbosus TaxID=931172 RepID=A0AAV6U9P2_9ARAC|nr:hypothetical protein JTE90_013935 [Oedothorax gibbosus]
MDKTSKNPPRCYFPKRYIVVILGFLGMFNTYAMRVNLSVAMVAMVNTTSDSNKSRVSDECPAPSNANETHGGGAETKGDRYDWSPEMQGWVLSSFFYGYVVTVLAGGYMAERYGAARVFGGGLLLTGVATLLTPLVVGWGVGALMAVRVVEGLGEGVTFPATTAIVSRWSPRMERSIIASVIFSGAQMGNVITMSVSGVLCSTDFLGGWPSVFYVFGTVTVLWFVLWIILVYETPDEHPSITEGELTLFHDSGKVQTQSNVGFLFGMFIFLTELPTYLSTVHHFNIHAVGYLSALPYITVCFGIWIASYTADRLRQSGKLSITTIRKVFNSLGGYGPFICVIAITFSGCRPYLIVALFCLGLFIKGCMFSGFHVILVDMCPDFAGTVFGLTNGVASLSGIVGPMMVGYFTEDGYTIANWNKAFYVTAFIYFTTTTFFAVFASAELQPWGRAETAKSPRDEEKASQKGQFNSAFVEH